MRNFLFKKHPITQSSILLLGSSLVGAFFAFNFFETYTLIVFLVSSLSIFILSNTLLFGLDFLLYRKWKIRVHLLIVIPLLFIYYRYLLKYKLFHTPKILIWSVIILMSVFTLALLLLLESSQKDRKRWLLIVLITAIHVAFYGFEFSRGFGPEPEYIPLEQINQSELLLEIPATHAYETIDFTGDTVDLLWLLEDQEDLSFDAREIIFGFTYDEIPLRGRIYLPVGEGPFPLFVMIHGNHKMVTPSHLGYDYLGEYLATRGIAMVSLDQNMLNGYADDSVKNDNPARAILLLESLNYLEKLNKQSNHRLYKQLSFENITLAGHSRGGESIVIASSFNDLDNYPGNEEMKFDYHFDIRSLLALSPTHGLYTLNRYPTDVNYVTIHGSHDQDVTTFRGEYTYQRMKVNDESFKSTLYIANANHGQFNSTWGINDSQPPKSLNMNTANHISESDQQEIVKTYAYHLVCVSTNPQCSTRELFSDVHAFTSQLPMTWYSQRFHEGGQQVIENFESESNHNLEGSIQVEIVELTTRHKNQSRQNDVLEIKASPGGSIAFAIESSEVDVISLDIAILQESMDATVTLSFAKDEEVTYSLNELAVLTPPYPVTLSKWERLFQVERRNRSIMLETIRINLPYDDLETMSISFNETSHLYLDEVSIKSKAGE